MRKNAKLLLILLLIGVMVFSVVGCSQNNTQPPVNNEEPGENETPALDPQEVVLEAAKAYFPKVADDKIGRAHV